MKRKLICTFTPQKSINLTIDYIQSFYDIYRNRFFVYGNRDDYDSLFLFYNIEDSDISKKPKDTVIVHRKSDSDTFYTLDALNALVRLVNNGKEDKTFQIDWNNYPNNFITADKEGNLKFIFLEFRKIMYI